MADGKFDVEGLSFDLEAEIGKLFFSEEIHPGTFFLTVEQKCHLRLKDYYIVLETAEIFPIVKSYGRALPGLRLYDVDIPDSGWQIVN